MKPLWQREFRRILLIKPSSMGDVLHAIPVLWGLRGRYPEAKISWLVAEGLAPLIANHPALDEVILFDRRRYGKVGRSVAVTGEFLRFAAALRQRRFDLVVDLQGLFRSGFLSFVCGSSVRIGPSGARELAGLFYTTRVRLQRGDVHAVERNYGVSRVLGFADEPINLRIPVSESSRGTARVKLSVAGLGSGEPFLAVSPGARWETKRWFPESFARTIDQIHERLGVRSVLLGSVGECELCGEVGRLCKSEAMNLAGETSPSELAAVVAEAGVVLCNDSGTKDVAVAVGRPVVTVFGPTSPERTGAYGRGDDVVRVDLECSPCYLRKLSRCRYDHECMRLVHPEQVAERIAELWGCPQGREAGTEECEADGVGDGGPVGQTVWKASPA